MARSYEHFTQSMRPSVKPIMELLRNYCNSLGDDVIEIPSAADLTFHTVSTSEIFVYFHHSDHDLYMTTRAKEGTIQQYQIEINECSDIIYAPLDLSEAMKKIQDAYIANLTPE